MKRFSFHSWVVPNSFFFYNRDFPGGKGESECIGRATLADISSPEGRRLLGFEEFTTNEGGFKAEFIEKANRALALE